MPDLSSNLTAIRASGHQIRLWAAIFAGTVVYTADIDAVDGTYTVSELTISGGVGTFSDVKRGQEVIIYNSSAEEKGRVRIRRSGTLSVSNIPIAETARGSVGIVAGDTLAVVDDHRLRPVFPDATTAFNPDEETYTNQTEVMAPVACSGGHTAQFVDVGQTYATVQFYGSNSFTLDSDSGSTVTHSWTFPSGSTPTSSTSADPSVQIPVGEHIIEHTVTDSSNLKTRTQYVWCGVYDSNNLPYRVDADSLQLSGTEDMGWEASFNLVGSYGTDSFPDGAWVVLFSEEIYNGTQQSFGNRNSGRAAIKFVGILQNDSSDHNGEDGRQDLQLTAVSPIQVLRELAGFSQYFDSKVTAATWQEIEDLTTKKVLIHLLRTYTTALEVLDFYYEAEDYSYPALAFQKATPYDQLMEIVNGLEARFNSDRTANLAVQRYPEFYEIADRSGLTTTLTLAERDILRIRVERAHREPVRLLEGRGFYSSGIALGGIYSRWPSLTPGEGAQDSVVDWLLATDQDDLNTKTGLHGAKLNHVYIASDGQKQIAPRITVDVYRDVFDFWQEWVAFSLDATSNWREIDLSAFRWVIRSIDVSYTNNTVDVVTLTLDAETAGPPGQTYIPPVEDDLQFPEIEIPPIEWIPPADPGPYPINLYAYETGAAAALLSNGKIAVTGGWDGSAPSWTENDHSATIPNIGTYTTDASSTYFTNGDGTGKVAAWVADKSNIFHIDDIFATTPTINNQHTFATASTNYPVLDSDFIFAPGSNAVAIYDIVNDVHVAARTTNGTTWTEADVQSTSPLSNLIGRAFVFYSTNTAGLIHCYAADEANDDYTLYKSPNYGATWSIVDGGTKTLNIGARTQPTKTLYFPFRGAGDQIFWMGWGTKGFYVGDTANTVMQLLEVGGWFMLPSGKFLAQGAYTRNAAYIVLFKTSVGQSQIFKTTTPGAYTPSFAPVPGTHFSAEISGFDISPDGSRMVMWVANKVYEWTEDNPTWVLKGTFSTAIQYVFVK